MAAKTKTPRAKAADYLQELADSTEERWLRTLIVCVIATRACPRPRVMDRIFEELLSNYGLADRGTIDLLATESEVASVPVRHFVLKSVKHGTGVNALKDGAELTFHPKLTVVFGKNGSGKSGFVRILKRVAGSKTQEEIWQNVHKNKSQNKCTAVITYANDAGDVPVDWTGQSSVAPFRDIGVFDGKCVSVHLTKSLSFSYQPHGFELFQATTEALSDLQGRLTAAIRAKEGEKPLLAFCNARTEAGQFLARVSGKTTRAELDRIAKWDAKNKNALAGLIARKNGLQNLDSQKELLGTRLGKLNMLEEVLRSIGADLSTRNLKLYASLAAKRAKLQVKRTAKKGKTLEDYEIPEKDSDEWEAFISAGEDYISLAQDEEYPHHEDQCVYCQQKLSKTAHRLIQLYRELYRSEESSDLDDVQEQWDEAVKFLEAATYGNDFPYDHADFKAVLSKATIARAFAAIASADSLARRVAEVLRGKSTANLKAPSLSSLLSAVSKAKEKVAKEIRAVADSQKTIRQQSAAIDKAVLALQDQQLLNKNRSRVETYIALDKWISGATPLAAKLRTRSITDLGKQAWEQLVSETFRQRFLTECTTLKTPQVSLAFRGEHGSQIRDKSVEGLTQIEDLLSEGEQKAVALADFFADESMQPEKTPLVFDDPANSFDHDRKRQIAKRIVDESGRRQVIVFTHDLMFASYLYERVEDPKKRELDAAKAAFHDVRAEGKLSGVVTRDYHPGAMKFDSLIKRIEARVPELAKLSGEKREEAFATTYSNLRRAVEKVVEERVFGRVISRWTDQIQMHNVANASLDRAKLEKAKELHEDFSRYIEAHNQSNEMIQHSLPDLETLKTDIEEVKRIAVR